MVEGNSLQNGTPSSNAPIEIKSIGTYNEETDKYEIDITNGSKTITMELYEPLRSVPNGVKDIAYIKGNKLYVDKNINKLVLNGTENWKTTPAFEGYYRFLLPINNCYGSTGYGDGFNTHFIQRTHQAHGNYEYLYIQRSEMGGEIYIQLKNITTLEEFKNWLAENNVIVQYEMSTPTTEEIGELTSFELVDGENNISNSENANMIINYIDDSINVTNKGNYIAKPIIEIKGYGTIGFILNGNKLFDYTFPDGEDTAVIDSEKQDAYLGLVLKNRNMNGEFPIFEIGENTITWEGNISSIKITSKSRWL